MSSRLAQRPPFVPASLETGVTLPVGNFYPNDKSNARRLQKLDLVTTLLRHAFERIVKEASALPWKVHVREPMSISSSGGAIPPLASPDLESVWKSSETWTYLLVEISMREARATRWDASKGVRRCVLPGKLTDDAVARELLPFAATLDPWFGSTGAIFNLSQLLIAPYGWAASRVAETIANPGIVTLNNAFYDFQFISGFSGVYVGILVPDTDF